MQTICQRCCLNVECLGLEPVTFQVVIPTPQPFTARPQNGHPIFGCFADMCNQFYTFSDTMCDFIIPEKAFARDYVFTGLGLSVCLSVCLFVTTISK